jgi:WhiB family redox-sensing transcriptional regulator
MSASDLLAAVANFRPEWQKRALCRGMGAEVFYNPRGSSARTTRARAMCKVCPVKDDCLEMAKTFRDRFGIWGDTNGAERRALGFVDAEENDVVDSDLN